MRAFILGGQGAGPAHQHGLCSRCRIFGLVRPPAGAPDAIAVRRGVFGVNCAPGAERFLARTGGRTAAGQIAAKAKTSRASEERRRSRRHAPRFWRDSFHPVAGRGDHLRRQHHLQSRCQAGCLVGAAQRSAPYRMQLHVQRGRAEALGSLRETPVTGWKVVSRAESCRRCGAEFGRAAANLHAA